MTDSFACVYRPAIIVVLAVVGVAVGWILFYRVPDTFADLAGLFLFVGTIVAALRVGGRFAASAFPDYDVAEVTVEGSISHDGGGGPIPGRGGGTPANDIAERADAAADSDSVDALLVKLSTPDGEVLSSDDIRRTVADFDGLTVAYTTDTCASDGYWITSSRDELWSHDMSVVGSIDVTGSSVSALELADEVGLSYKRFVTGKYKGAGIALKEPTEDGHEYLQGLIDDYYDDFVEYVAGGRSMDPQVIRGVETYVCLDEKARELGLVGSLENRDDVKDRLVEHLDRDEVSMWEFTPEVDLTDRLHGDVEGVTYTFGARLASSVDPDDGFSFRL